VAGVVRVLALAAALGVDSSNAQINSRGLDETVRGYYQKHEIDITENP